MNAKDDWAVSVLFVRCESTGGSVHRRGCFGSPQPVCRPKLSTSAVSVSEHPRPALTQNSRDSRNLLKVGNGGCSIDLGLNILQRHAGVLPEAGAGLNIGIVQSIRRIPGNEGDQQIQGNEEESSMGQDAKDRKLLAKDP